MFKPRQSDPIGNAELQLGSHPSNWHSRGYLPHFDRKNCIQSITFRLSDSLPKKKLEGLETILQSTASNTDKEQRKREQIETWLDSGMGCCALKHPLMAQTVEEAFMKFDNDRYKLIAWCVMPNHVHALIEPHIELAKIVQSWKSFTGRWGMAHNAELELGVPTEGSFWMREYWDRYIRNKSHLDNVIEYIHQNPVKAKLCNKAEDWPYSSANWERRTVARPVTT